MFVISELNSTRRPDKTNDIKNLREIVIDITGFEEDGDTAATAAASMSFGERYSDEAYYEIRCVKDDEADGILFNMDTERLAEIGRAAIDSFGELLNGKALYDALAGSLRMDDEEILAAGFGSLKEFMK